MKKKTQELAQAKLKRAEELFTLLHDRLRGNDKKYTKKVEHDLSILKLSVALYSSWDNDKQYLACKILYGVLKLNPQSRYLTVREKVKGMMRSVAKIFFSVENNIQLELQF